MELQAFLQSGLLESYVLGQCTPDEVRIVENMLAQHPEARAELKAIETALEKYALANSLTPPQWMKGRILEQIKLLDNKTTPPFSKNPISKLGLGVIVALGIAALTFAALFFNLKKHTEQQSQIIAHQQIAIDDCSRRDSLRAHLQQQVALSNHPATRKIVLHSIDSNNKTHVAVVYDNPETQQTLLGMTNLPDLPANQDYQLWVITKDKPAPVPLNTFSPQATAELGQKMAFYAAAQAFAISIEPKGGSPNGIPTTVILLGKV